MVYSFLTVVGRRPQGVLLGWFASAGSLARMTFPIMAGYIANFEDVIVLFIILTCVLIAATFFVVYKKSTLNMLSS
jgi:ceroid-lipofuscinosis MFS transporter 7